MFAYHLLAAARSRCSKAGKKSGETRRAQAANHWSYDEVFPAAYAEAQARYPKVTRRNLAYTAYKIAPQFHCSAKDREELTEARARNYLDRLRE
ncbi:MAG: hypothetical protein WBG92_21910 [Thiohalocapsa sp.]